jgi:cyanophycin synthetase
VAKDIVDHLFPTEESYNFPIVSVTGTNGKTTTVRLIAHTLAVAGRKVGYTSTSGTFIDESCVYKGDHSGPRSAKTLLANKSIDCAVLETARGGIIREGLGYETADVGIVMNIAEDHLGMDGTKTLEDLAFVKSLVTESVKENGFAVFNAEDGMTPFLMERTKANIIFFSKSPEVDPALHAETHIQVYTEDGWITVRDSGREIRVVPVADIPITRSGKIECNIENSLAAVSALYVLNIPIEKIAEGLKTYSNNAGRFNLYQFKNFNVMLDYGHNSPGYRQVIKACKNIGYHRLIGVIGMPGDRNNEAIQSVGRLCSESFDRIYIKEDIDKRGRKPREVAELFYRAITESGFEERNVQIIEDELDALKAAAEQAQDDDLIVVLYEKLEPLQDYLASQNAEQIL